MTVDDWAATADRIDALWTPKMTGAARGAYFDVLRELDGALVREAIAELAKSDRDRRPTAGLIFQTAMARVPSPPSEQAAVPKHDPLPAAQRGSVAAQLARVRTPEHNRRLTAVLATGKRFTLAQLSELLPEKACGPEEFDRRLEAWTKTAPTSSRPEPAPGQRRMLSSDPEEDW